MTYLGIQKACERISESKRSLQIQQLTVLLPVLFSTTRKATTVLQLQTMAYPIQKESGIAFILALHTSLLETHRVFHSGRGLLGRYSLPNLPHPLPITSPPSPLPASGGLG
ncbi:UNVERIFIED_CONTAM: hypothetical protein K2H54_061817 [Gekko kuhli]